MLFVSIILMSAGYTLVYAGVKGEHYKINGAPVWRQPWLPWVAAFSGKNYGTASVVTSGKNDEQWYVNALGNGASASSPPPSSGPASGPTNLPAPSAGQFYA